MPDPSLLDLAHLWFPWSDPFWSHYHGASPQASPAQRRELDTRTRTRFALARTSYPALARPPQRPVHPARHAPSQPASLPTSWEAFRNPIKATQDYAAALGQRLAFYAQDPVRGLTADFQDLRSHGRLGDVAWGAIEDDLAHTPVDLAKGLDFVVDHPPRPPYPFDRPNPDHPTPPHRKFAPIVERAMQPLLADAALRPPRTGVEQGIAVAARLATLLATPEVAGPKALAESGEAIRWGVDAYQAVREAGEELRAGLAAGKTWDQAYAALSTRARGALGTHWFRVGAGDATEAEQAAGLGARAPDTPSTLPPPPPSPPKIPTIRGRKPINSRYAGGVHPSGVRYTDQGFPEF